jgi:N-acyl-D-amino-acid deacylase
MFDLVLRNGRVLDGAGNSDFPTDVGIEGGRIAALGRLDGAEARETLEIGGLTVCPGFIDVHTHSDALPFAPEPLPAKILQGVTTEVTGNCGSTVFPLDERTKPLLQEHHAGIFEHLPWDWQNLDGFAQRLREVGPISNVAPLVGHGAVRVAVMAFERRSPTPDELDQMRKLLAQALEQGAVGFSSGLIYAPGLYSETPELVSLAEEMRLSGRPYASHIRGETANLFDAVREAVAIGQQSGVPVEVSHLKAAGRANHGRAEELLGLVDESRQRGVEVTADAYPYDSGSTRLAALLPPWCHEGGRGQLLERIRDPDAREQLKRDFREGVPGWDNMAGAAGWDQTFVATAENPEYVGRSIAQLSQTLGQDEVDAFCTVLLEEQGRPTVVVRMMAEADVRAILAHPLVMVGSDAIISKGRPHPRLWGTYPRVLGHYARDVGLFSQADASRSTGCPTGRQAEAVRKMTSFPAQKFKLWDRGIIRPGLAADLVVFDAATVNDRATYEDPEQPPIGMPHVLVNGEFAVRDGVYTGARAGQVLLAR